MPSWSRRLISTLQRRSTKTSLAACRRASEAAGQLKFGNPRQVRERLWQRNTVSLIDNLWRDLKYAARTLTRSPGFTVVAVLVMALGIGANIALFTVVRSVLLNPLPFRDSARLYAIYERNNRTTTGRYDADSDVSAGRCGELCRVEEVGGGHR